jgi:acetyl-CoA carboxylase carboxyl transferase subunit beta
LDKFLNLKRAKETNAPPPAEETGEAGRKLPETGEPAPKFSWRIKPQTDGKAKPVKDDIPDGLYIKCTGCKELIYTKELDKNWKICHKCEHHFRLGARERINLLSDAGSFEEIDAALQSADPLEFVSLAEPPYRVKSEQTRQKTGLNEAIVTGFATLDDFLFGLAVIDFSYQGGSMGSVVGEKLARLIEACIQRGLPLVTVSASGGARMHEGMFSLMQMAKTTAALAKLSEAGLPHISILTDPCTGGVSASYASVADIVIAEPGALIGFAGPRVIEQITKQKLPTGFQTAEFLLEHGMIDAVVARKELRQYTATLLKLYKRAAFAQPFYELEREVEVNYA